MSNVDEKELLLQCVIKQQEFNRVPFTSCIGEDLRTLKSLVEDGLLVQCSKIEHPANSMNPAYSFVTNDEKGLTIAKQAAY